jgi:uncharacterized protein (DUF2267 family)
LNSASDASAKRVACVTAEPDPFQRFHADGAIYFGAQLPLLRGVYYEGWHPTGHPISFDRTALFSRIEDALHRDSRSTRSKVARSAFALIAERIDPSELGNVKASMPSELRGHWPS